MSYAARIAGELAVSTRQVQATIDLLEEGGTIPFIARYRKEATGMLDEVAVASIRDRLDQLSALDKRRQTILESLEEQSVLTEALREQVEAAPSLSTLEDIYLPYRPKRRTRATIARERGLEPLAALVFEQIPTTDPQHEGLAYAEANDELENADEALAGARDIIAEWINENTQARATLRDLYLKSSTLRTRVIVDKENEGNKFRDYFDWQEPMAQAPSHRVLAMRRGEKEEILSFRVVGPEEECLAALEAQFLRGPSPSSDQVRLALHDAYKRLMSLSMETEMRLLSKKRADEEAIRVFAENLRQLLLAPPLGEKSTLAIDPGFRTGCKVVCLDRQGSLCHTDVIFPDRHPEQAGRLLTQLCSQHRIEAIAIGNGTGGRETERFVRSLNLDASIHIAMVNESGASVYSASEVARAEFPDHDLTVRGSVSIGRRLMDPLAELVKIDPKSIGVGQYQHDVDPTELKHSLDDVVVSCVNSVGVEVNTASEQLLAYVSGLGPQLARNVVEYRRQHGPFTTRKDLLNVDRLGPKAFELSAGFLRIRDGVHPLDSSAVHPERYALVEQMAQDMHIEVADLLRRADLRASLELERYTDETVGLPTLRDIVEELDKPGRDPREQISRFSFADGIEKIEDLQPGQRLPGIVTNVTAFGAFVDIGVHQDGLVHISQLADRYVKDPNEVVKVQQRVQVRVVEVDLERRRIALSLRSEEAAAPKQPTSSSSQGTQAPPAKGQPQQKKSKGPKLPTKHPNAPASALAEALLKAGVKEGK